MPLTPVTDTPLMLAAETDADVDLEAHDCPDWYVLLEEDTDGTQWVLLEEDTDGTDAVLLEESVDTELDAEADDTLTLTAI